MVPEGMGAVSLRHFLWHKAQFDEWTNPEVEQTVIDKVDTREIQGEIP
jgi:hypothetical protein